MHFCYIHQRREATGKCSGCDRFICFKDYKLIDEKIKEEEYWEDDRFRRTRGSYRRQVLTGYEYWGPVIYCPSCYNEKLGIHVDKQKPEIQTTVFKKRKLLMCFQCGVLLQPDDKFCENCGDSTIDEIEAIENPLDGVRALKKLK